MEFSVFTIIAHFPKLQRTGRHIHLLAFSVLTAFEMKHSKPGFSITVDEKPTVHNNNFPLHSLDHRAFELFIYSLYKSEIEQGSLKGAFDDIWLMEGVREKGKDCSLYRNGQLAGLVQCKHSSTLTRIGKPEVVSEIIKFLLHLIKSGEELSVYFSYYFAVSYDFNTAARELLEDFNAKVFKEESLQKWTENVIENNKGLEKLKFDEVSERLYKFLKEIKIHHLASTDILLLINKPYNAGIISTFFTVRMVVEEATVLQQTGKILDSLSVIHSQVAEKPISADGLVQQLEASSLFLARYNNEFSNLPGSHIIRRETEELFTWVKTPLPSEKTDERIILLTGNAGCGKSVILRDLFDQLRNNNIPVLGIKADRFPATSIKDLEEKLYLPGNLITQLERLSGQVDKIVVLVDQIDALSQTLASQRDAINTYQLLINSIKRIDNIRIIISVRTYDLNYDPDLQFYKKQRSVKVSPLTEAEVNAVLEKLNVEPRQLSGTLRNLLTTANHLNVFCKIVRPGLAFETIRTIQDLYQELWKQLMISIPPETSIKPGFVESCLHTLAQAMNKQQLISLPAGPFQEGYAIEIEYLSSQGILNFEENTVQFFHQTFYDFVFAKSFVESGKSVLDYITENKNSLFIRSNLKMILGFLSEKDHEQYIRIVRRLLTSGKYLFHIKLLTYNLLGFVEDPSDRELELIQNVILPNPYRRNLFLESVLSEKLLAFLIKEGTLNELLSQPVEPNAKNSSHKFVAKLGFEKLLKCFIRPAPKVSTIAPTDLCYNVLARHLPQSRKLIIDYLLTCPPFEGKAYFVFRILYFVKHWDVEGGFRLFETYKSKAYADSFQFYHILEEAADYNLDWVIAIYKPILLSEIEGENQPKKNNPHSYQKEKLFEKLFQLDAVKAFNFAWEIIEKMISKNPRPKILHPELSNDYQFMMYDYDRSDSERGTYNELYTQMIEALTVFIQSNWVEFEENYQRIKSAGKMSFFRMLTYALNNQTDNLVEIKDVVYDFIFESHRRNALVSDEKFEFHIRKTLQNYFGVFDEMQKDKIVDMILSLKDPYELQIHDLLGKRSFFKNYGLTKYRYLKTLPEEYVLGQQKTRRIFQELTRRYGGSKEVEPFKVRMYSVGPPLNQNAYEKMDFDQWLNCFRIYDSDLREHRDNPEKGGLIENYRAFKAQVEKRPDHFLPFVERLFSENVHAAYGIAGLDGLKSAKIPIRDFFRLYKLAIKKLYETSEMMQLIWMADYLIAADVMDEEVLNFLIHQALHNLNPEEDKGQPLHESINTVRGAAVEKLTKIDFNPAWANRIFETMDRVAEDSRISVRVSLISRLAFMMNLDKERTLSIFLKLTRNFQKDIYLASIWSAQYIANYNFEKLRPYFNAFMKNPDDIEEIATIAAIGYLNEREGSKQLINDLFQTTDKASAKIIHVGWYNNGVLA